MFAIIEAGSKQFQVSKGDIIETEKFPVAPGQEAFLDKVLLISEEDKVTIGRPYIKGAKVTVEMIAEVKGEKAVSFKYKRRKNSRWKKGHRQQLLRLKIKEISA